MTKQQVRVELDIDWIDALDYLPIEAAIIWLQRNVPSGVTLEREYYGHEGACNGIAYHMRGETDEEYEARLTKEAQLAREKAHSKRLREESQAAHMERLRMEGVAVHNYLSKHIGNPRIGDLENLFRTTAQLEAQGKVGVVLDNLKECMARLEKAS